MPCSTLIWDYKFGEIVCADNGEVVGKIYDYSPSYEEQEQPHPRREPRRVIKAFTISMKKYNKKLQIYRRMMMLEQRLGDKYVVDEEKFFEIHMNKKNQIMTIKHRKTLEIKTTPEDERVIDEGKKYLEEHAPHLLSRGLRGKLALSYIVGHILKYQSLPKGRTITAKFKISATTWKRLKRLALQIVPTAVR